MGDKNYSEEEKIETIYNFITEDIRYSYVPFRQSGLIPEKSTKCPGKQYWRL